MDGKTVDLTILILILGLSFLGYVRNLGLYSDDWAFLASMKFSHDQSLVGLYSALQSKHDVYFRPIQWLLLSGLFKLFEFDPTGYHIVNSAFLCVGGLLLYLLATEFSRSRLLALSTTTVFVLLPDYSTDRFWIATLQANTSMCFCLFGLYAQLKCARAPHSSLWVLFATICVFGVSFSYEIFLPLFLLMACVVCLAQALRLFGYTVAKERGHSFMETALQQTPVVLAVITSLIVKLSVAQHQPPRIEMTEYVGWSLHQIVKAFPISFGYHFLQTPATTWAIARDHATAATLIAAFIVATIIYVRLVTLRETVLPNSRRKELLTYLAFGLAVFVAGHSFYPIDPARDGINNRAAIASALGVAISAVGLFGLVATFAPRFWHKPLFCAMVALLCACNFLKIDGLATYWTESYRQETKILSDIRKHFENIPSGSAFLLDGTCPYVGPAIVFGEYWDLSSALMILYGHTRIRASIVTRSTIVERDGVVPKSSESTKYSFDSMLVYHVGRSERFQFSDATGARDYFEKASDKMRLCPPDEYGNGVALFLTDR